MSLTEANQFFEQHKVARYGWLPHGLRLALHKELTRPLAPGQTRDVELSHLQALGRHFASLSPEQRDAAIKNLRELEAHRARGLITLATLLRRAAGKGTPMPLLRPATTAADRGTLMPLLRPAPTAAGRGPLMPWLPPAPTPVPTQAENSTEEQKFSLADLFNPHAKRKYGGWESSPLLHLLFQTENFPPEHRPHFFSILNLDSKWLRRLRYPKQVIDGSLALEPVIIMRGTTQDKVNQDVISIHPLAKKVDSPWRFWKRGAWRGDITGTGIDSFHVVVHDPAYYKAAKTIARGLSRLTKKTVGIRLLEKLDWRDYNEGRPIDPAASLKRKHKGAARH